MGLTKNLMNKIQKCTLALGMGASVLGCATQAPVQNNVINQAMDVLRISCPSQIQHLPGGYKTTRDTAATLRTLAGVYAGTVDLEKTEKGYSAKGIYNQIENPEALEKVLMKADTDGDYIITRDELKSLADIMYQKHAN